VSRVEKIFLSQVAKFRAKFARNFQMVVDDEADVGAFSYGNNFFRHAPDFIGRRIFGAELDQVAAAVAKLPRDEFGRAAMQTGRVNKCVKLAICERFHFSTTKYTKRTEEKRKTAAAQGAQANVARKKTGGMETDNHARQTDVSEEL